MLKAKHTDSFGRKIYSLKCTICGNKYNHPFIISNPICRDCSPNDKKKALEFKKQTAKIETKMFE